MLTARANLHSGAFPALLRPNVVITSPILTVGPGGLKSLNLRTEMLDPLQDASMHNIEKMETFFSSIIYKTIFHLDLIVFHAVVSEIFFSQITIPNSAF